MQKLVTLSFTAFHGFGGSEDHARRGSATLGRVSHRWLAGGVHDVGRFHRRCGCNCRLAGGAAGEGGDLLSDRASLLKNSDPCKWTAQNGIHLVQAERSSASLIAARRRVRRQVSTARIAVLIPRCWDMNAEFDQELTKRPPICRTEPLRTAPFLDAGQEGWDGKRGTASTRPRDALHDGLLHVPATVVVNEPRCRECLSQEPEQRPMAKARRSAFRDAPSTRSWPATTGNFAPCRTAEDKELRW